MQSSEEIEEVIDALADEIAEDMLDRYALDAMFERIYETLAKLIGSEKVDEDFVDEIVRGIFDVFFDLLPPAIADELRMHIHGRLSE